MKRKIFFLYFNIITKKKKDRLTIKASSLFFFTHSGENGYKTYIFKDEFMEAVNPLIRNGRIKIGLYLRMYDPNDALGIIIILLISYNFQRKTLC